jgi:hypothetical protein
MNTDFSEFLPSHSQPPLPSLPDEDDHQVLQDHYVRMQKTLVHAVDQELAIMETHLQETLIDLKTCENDKTAMGVALYQANLKMGRMNSQLQQW